MAEQTYILQFNENQQCFHMNLNDSEINKNGWIVISTSITDKEFSIFAAYIARIKMRRYHKRYLVNSLNEVKKFMNNLIDYNLQITNI